MMTTYIVRRCARCNEVIYRFKKGEQMSDLVKGANIGIHLIVCDPETFDDHVRRFF
jgi:hypothetical protein